MLNKRLQNKVLQILYKPKQKSLVPKKTLKFFEELDDAIDKKITPLLAELFTQNNT